MRQQNELNDVKVNSQSIQGELDLFEVKLGELKILYEQYFSGFNPMQPTKEHQEIKFKVRALHKTPFKNSQANFRMKNLILRYQTLNTHWERVLRAKEDGTYVRDRFKAKIRSEEQHHIRHKKTDEGQRDSRFKELFNSYKSALDKQGLTLNRLDFNTFKKDLEQKANLLAEKSGGQKVKFAVEVTEGKVSIKAKILGNTS